jgi:kinesin family protein 20
MMAAEFTPALRPEDSILEEQDPGDWGGVKKRLFDEVSDGVDNEPEAPDGKKPVLIYLRVRPKRPIEVSNCDPDCLHQTSGFEMLAIPPKTSKTYKNSRTETNHKFSFSHIFNPATTQKELFDETLKPLLKDFFGGQNCLVFTYGVTNSGTSYSVLQVGCPCES